MGTTVPYGDQGPRSVCISPHMRGACSGDRRGRSTRLTRNSGYGASSAPMSNRAPRGRGSPSKSYAGPVSTRSRAGLVEPRWKFPRIGFSNSGSTFIAPPIPIGPMIDDVIWQLPGLTVARVGTPGIHMMLDVICMLLCVQRTVVGPVPASPVSDTVVNAIFPLTPGNSRPIFRVPDTTRFVMSTTAGAAAKMPVSPPRMTTRSRRSEPPDSTIALSVGRNWISRSVAVPLTPISPPRAVTRSTVTVDEMERHPSRVVHQLHVAKHRRQIQLEEPVGRCAVHRGSSAVERQGGGHRRRRSEADHEGHFVGSRRVHDMAAQSTRLLDCEPKVHAGL